MPPRSPAHGLKTRHSAVLIEASLFLVVVLPAALFAVVTYRLSSIGRQCPQCHGETVALVDRWLRILSRLHPLGVFQRRWCPVCYWAGAVRVPRRQNRAVTTASRKRRQSTDTLDLRWLTVDGRRWRVLLHCWCDTGLFYGRYVFIAPSGRLWLDGVDAFSGSTPHEVLSQALTPPDGLLINRVRRLVGNC